MGDTEPRIVKADTGQTRGNLHLMKGVPVSGDSRPQMSSDEYYSIEVKCVAERILACTNVGLDPMSKCIQAGRCTDAAWERFHHSWIKNSDLWIHVSGNNDELAVKRVIGNHCSFGNLTTSSHRCRDSNHRQ